MKPNSYVKLNFRELVWLVVVVAGMILITTEVKSFANSWHHLISPNIFWLSVILLLVIMTYVCAALTYYFLAVRRLNLNEVFVIQLASMFINRLIPAGIGGIGANYEYLRHRGHKVSQAASVVAANNVLGLMGHGFILVLTLLFASSSSLRPKLSLKNSEDTLLIVSLAIFAILVVVALSLKGDKLRMGLKEFLRQFISFARRPLNLVLAYFSQIGLSLCNMLCLFFSIKAIGLKLSFGAAVIIFTFASGVRNITPTPGGLGGYEASLVAGLAAYGLSASSSLAAVVLFRLLTYLIPLIFGALAFFVVSKKRLLG